MRLFQLHVIASSFQPCTNVPNSSKVITLICSSEKQAHMFDGLMHTVYKCVSGKKHWVYYPNQYHCSWYISATTWVWSQYKSQYVLMCGIRVVLSHIRVMCQLQPCMMMQDKRLTASHFIPAPRSVSEARYKLTGGILPNQPHLYLAFPSLRAGR